MPTVRKRSDIAWVAIALTLGAGGAAIATASSRADGDANAPASSLPIAAISDPALTSTNPADSDAAARLADAAGVAGSTATPQAWRVGGRAVIGYLADDGRFCFAFRELSGGCVRAGTLNDERPLDITVDHGPVTFRVYGLALDGVMAVAVRIDGTDYEAELAHNAFTSTAPALRATTAAAGEVVATMSDGTTRIQGFPIAPLGEP